MQVSAEELLNVGIVFLSVSGETPQGARGGAQDSQLSPAPDAEDKPVSPHQTPSRGPGMRALRCEHVLAHLYMLVLLRSFVCVCVAGCEAGFERSLRRVFELCH